MKLLRILSKLGLNLKTGISETIEVSEIEDMYHKKITGNGSIIRRDVKPWVFLI